uniref:transcobalamin-2 isoform X4 n=1 Tax=Pristiophorus japonicus TaxID=55135 RepID=UPI00398ED207
MTARQVVFLKCIMQLKVLLLISCIQVLFLAVKLETDPEAIIKSLNLQLLRSTGPSSPANPSIHIALRLSADHSLHDERRYLHRLKTDLRNKLSSSSGSQRESEPSTGLVALYLLALRASCQDLPSRQRALAYLKNQLSAEKNHTKHTAAMMVLALKCVHESKVPSSGHWMYSHDRRAKAQTAVNKLMEKIQRRQTQSGKIGNIYSTAVALQALLAVGDMERWSKGKGRVLIEARGGAFHNPMALSQLLPVLYQKTYMDIGQMDCNSETDGLRKKQHSDPVITDQGTETNSHQQTALVYLTVKDMNSAVIYTAEVPLHDQMSLLGVLNEAKRNDTSFNFETKQTLWGPFLTSVQHIQAQDNTRTYWRLIRGENTPLIQGIQDYHPQPGEHILLQLSKF